MSLSLHDYRSDAGVAKWLSALGVVDAPVPRSGVREALGYFSIHIPNLRPDDALDYLRATDLSKSVRSVLISPGERLIAFRSRTESPYKLFFTRPGRAATDLGINDANRDATHFTARAPLWALESHASEAIDFWTRMAPNQRSFIAPRANSSGYMASGGAMQLIVPRSFATLFVSRVPAK